MMLLNMLSPRNNEAGITTKKVINYKENIDATIEKAYVYHKIYGSKVKRTYDIGLENNQEVILRVIRNIKDDTVMFEITLPQSKFKAVRQKIITLNEKDLVIENDEVIEKEKVRFLLKKYNDNTPIKFDDLKTFQLLFHYPHRQGGTIYAAFRINFNLKRTNLDLHKINLKENNLNLDLIESINFVINKRNYKNSRPFENNTAFLNKLVYDFNFYDIKQNDFLYKAIEQNIELKNSNTFFLPKGNYIYDFFNKVYISEEKKKREFELNTKVTNLDKFKHKVEYFINKRNKWDFDKKDFFDTEERNLLGYHVPLRFSGDLNMRYELNQKILGQNKEARYSENFPIRLFDSKEGIIKLHTEVIKIEDKNLETMYENWITKNLS